MNSDGARARTTESLDHLLLAASRSGVRNKRYFDALDEQAKNLITLWSLASVVPKSGLGEFLRAEPKWLVTHAAQAIRSLGEEKAALASNAKKASALSSSGSESSDSDSSDSSDSESHYVNSSPKSKILDKNNKFNNSGKKLKFGFRKS